MVTILVKNGLSNFSLECFSNVLYGQLRFECHWSSYKHVTKLATLCYVNRPFAYILIVEVEILG